jgi:hypothetical protein
MTCNIRMRTRLAVAVVLGVTAATLLPLSSAHASVRPTAAPWTPRVLTPNAVVRKLAQCGHTMYAVGQFDRIGHGGQQYSRDNAFSFNARTGAVTSWNPDVDGTVNSIAVGPHCRTAFLGGKFDSVGGTQVHNLAAVAIPSGTVRPVFGHTANGEVETLALVRHGEHLLVGGAFETINGTARAYLASVDPKTGTVDSYLRPQVTGKLPTSTGRSMVYNSQVSPRGDRLLIEGDFTHVGGRLRLQLAELNLGANAATVNKWHNYRLNHTACSNSTVFYGRAAAFSPDEKTIYLAATGYRGTSPFCDAVSAFTNTAPARVKWINWTGGDSLYSVAAAPRTVYIGGHERWANNSKGTNSCGPGCVHRPGIGAINAISGRATKWNPTRDRGHGADDLLLTSAGLWVASDTYFHSVLCAHKHHAGICFFPRRT